MKIYSQDDEEKIRAQTRVREWHRSGFLDASQAAQISTELRVDLRRTNFFLRAVLFLFTAIVVTAAVALFVTIANVDSDAFTATTCIVAAIGCFASAHFLIGKFRFYRFGVEEAFAAATVVLSSVAVGLIAPRTGDFKFAAALAVAAVGFLAIYLRFGYVYCAVAAMVCATAVPLPLVRSAEVTRLLAAVVCAFTFGVVRRGRLAHVDEFPGDDYGTIQAAAWGAIYLALNLQVLGASYKQDAFYWLTYALTWILPIIGFWLAIPRKDRPLMNVNLVLSLITLSTNKSYLHQMRQPWDPILLGLLLVGCAMITKRWLANGSNAQRRGFTAVRLLAGDRRSMDFLSTASTALHQPHSQPAPAKPAGPDFGGGRSGGAGASGSF